MTKEEAIKYLQQLYPNGGHCWLDEQRIEAIGMAVKALQEEPTGNPFGSTHAEFRTAVESLGISQEEHDRIVDECIYGKEPELVDADDLPKEEHASEIDFEQELYKAFGQVKDFTLGMRIAKWFYDMGKNNQEHVSEDLEEAAHKYADIRMSNYETAFYAFMSGAQWKEQQFEKERLKHCDELTKEQAQIESNFVTQHLKKNNRTPTFIDAIEYGMKLQKKQMIKDAYEREVKVDAGGYPYIPQMELYDYDKDEPLAKKGEKVKVVVIKED